MIEKNNDRCNRYSDFRRRLNSLPRSAKFARHMDTDRMTMTFYDKAGREMLAEQIS
jgi:hypothetical protein